MFYIVNSCATNIKQKKTLNKALWRLYSLEEIKYKNGKNSILSNLYFILNIAERLRYYNVIFMKFVLSWKICMRILRFNESFEVIYEFESTMHGLVSFSWYSWISGYWWQFRELGPAICPKRPLVGDNGFSCYQRLSCLSTWPRTIIWRVSRSLHVKVLLCSFWKRVDTLYIL